MPTALRVGPYRIYFFSNERSEPPHVHVDRERLTAKFWLEPVVLARNRGFTGQELNRLRSILVDHRAGLLEAWHEFFEA